MTHGTAIDAALRAGLSLHGLAVLDPAAAAPAPACAVTVPLTDWGRLVAGDLPAVQGRPMASRFYVEPAGLARAPGDGSDPGDLFRALASSLAPKDVATHLLGDALRRETLRDDPEGFSEEFYSREYVKVAGQVERGMVGSHLEHYVRLGARIGNNPNAAFRERYYLQRHPDVRAAVERGDFVSGFHHFLAAGKREGRSYRPAERLAAVDLTFLATPAANGAFAALSVSVLVAVVRLLRGVEFVLLLPEALYDAFSPWDAENVRRQAVPTSIRRPAPELLNLRPDCLISFGRPSLFRGEEKARLTVVPDPTDPFQLGFVVEAGAPRDRKGSLAFAGGLDALVCTREGERLSIPFAAQKAMRDDSFPKLLEALQHSFGSSQPFLPSGEIVGLDEDGDMGLRAYVNARVERPGTILAVLLHCPEGRPRQDLSLRVRDASLRTVSEFAVTISPGHRLWQEVDLPVGLVQVEFTASAPKKVIVGERWRQFFSARFVEARLRSTAETRLVNPARAAVDPIERQRAGIEQFEFLAGYKGAAHAREVFEALGRLSKALPAYRPRMRRFRWLYDLVRRPRFLVVSPSGGTSLERRFADRRARCLLDWARRAGFETELRESDFARGWFRGGQFGVSWRDVDCCVLLGTTEPDGLAAIRQINSDLILLAYTTGDPVRQRRGIAEWLRAAAGRPRRSAAGHPDHVFLDHLAVFRRGRFPVDAVEDDLQYLPSYPPPPPAGGSRIASRRCGIYVSSVQVLRRVLASSDWVRSLEALRLASPGWTFSLVVADAGEPEADLAAGIRESGVEWGTLAALQAKPTDLRALVFWETDAGLYVDVMVECIAHSLTCIVDTAVRARLSRELYAHTSSITMPAGALAPKRLDDIVFEFDGSQFAADLERLFRKNLGDMFGRIAERRFGGEMRVLPNHWSKDTV